MRFGALALIGALYSGAAQAEIDIPIKGIDLARACKSDASADKALCRGFINGFTYGSQMAVGAKFVNQWRYGEQTWCFPRAADELAVREAFIAYAQANTGTLHFPAALIVASAMAAKFPCS